jgi:hypothetical protein
MQHAGKVFFITVNFKIVHDLYTLSRSGFKVGGHFFQVSHQIIYFPYGLVFDSYYSSAYRPIDIRTPFSELFFNFLNLVGDTKTTN